MSTFQVAGVSILNGVCKVRFANSMDRVKILVKGGHEGVELMTLPNPMTKPEVCKYLLTVTDLMANPAYRAGIEEADAKYNPVAVVKAPKAAKAKPATKTKEEKLAELTARAEAVGQSAE
jgi:hypothetical protein